MARWTRPILIAAFAAHSLWGCCGHHAHACPPRCAVGDELVAHVEAGCADVGHDGAPHGSSNGHREPDHCRGSVCVYVVRTQDHADAAVPMERGAVDLMPPRLSIHPEALTQPASSSELLLLPIRLHLMHQVLRN